MQDTIAGVMEKLSGDSIRAINLTAPQTVEMVEELHEILMDGDDPASVNLIVSDAVFKTVADNFNAGIKAQELITEDLLEIRTTDSTLPSLIVGSDTMQVVISGDEGVHSVESSNDELLPYIGEEFDSLWEQDDTESVEFRVPAYSNLFDSMDDQFGSEFTETFREAIEDPLDNESEIDSVAVAILVTAQQKELLYDISKWGEDVGLSSKATFSRTKTQLEDAGIIGTEKVPIDVGRPRLRLKLTDAFADADIMTVREQAEEATMNASEIAA